MKKILILGSKGMAGHVMKYFLTKNTGYIIHDVARNSEGSKPTWECDITDKQVISGILQEERYDIVINCIGSLNKDAEDNPDKAIYLNSYLPHFIAREIQNFKGKLIHISTDCVFSGKQGGYTESSIQDGEGYYARSKALGEVSYKNHLTFRTSIIGPELKPDGIGLFHWFMQQTEPVNGFSKAIWTGVTTLELAKATKAAIEQDITGLYHLVNGSSINKYELLQLFAKEFNKHIRIDSSDKYIVDKSLVNNRNDFQYNVPSYQQMISELKEWMIEHRDIYSMYKTGE